MMQYQKIVKEKPFDREFKNNTQAEILSEVIATAADPIIAAEKIAIQVPEPSQST